MKNASNYLTIKEASERTGKHADTIRAWLKKNKIKITRDENGRILIPMNELKNTYELIESASEKGGQNAVMNEEKVGQKSADSEPEKGGKKVAVRNADEVLVELLKNELEKKNEQIAQQMKTIDDMQKTLTNLVNQQQQLSGALMLNSGKNPSTEQGEKKKKHFWNRNK